jgi:hypothetical protein
MLSDNTLIAIILVLSFVLTILTNIWALLEEKRLKEKYKGKGEK